MNEYQIEYRVQTLAQLYESEPFSYNGFDFFQWEFTPSHAPTGHAWLARKTIQAPEFRSAYKCFTDDLYPLVDKISFVSQCTASLISQPYIIRKLNSNERNLIYIHCSYEANGVPLGFLNLQIKALKKLEKFKEKGDVFATLREATNANSFYTTFAMLAAALEAIAGEANKKGRKATDHEYIKREILQDEELWENIFGYGTGYRNKLLHGINIEPELHLVEDENIIDRIYVCINRYFKEKHGVILKENITNPRRTITGNFRRWRGWIKPNSPATPLDLRFIWEGYKSMRNEDGIKEEGKSNELFTHLMSEPSGY